ncbi:MAG: Rossmann fold domain-containing protein [Pseudomonadota bacterium]
MDQAVHVIDGLPENPLEAAAAYFADHHTESLALLSHEDTVSLVIVLESASYDHDGWRRSLAGDLARRYAPKRCNLVGTDDPEAAKALLAFLESARGVTGQYLAGHE